MPEGLLSIKRHDGSAAPGEKHVTGDQNDNLVDESDVQGLPAPGHPTSLAGIGTPFYRHYSQFGGKKVSWDSSEDNMSASYVHPAMSGKMPLDWTGDSDGSDDESISKGQDIAGSSDSDDVQSNQSEAGDRGGGSCYGNDGHHDDESESGFEGERVPKSRGKTIKQYTLHTRRVPRSSQKLKLKTVRQYSRGAPTSSTGRHARKIPAKIVEPDNGDPSSDKDEPRLVWFARRYPRPSSAVSSGIVEVQSARPHPRKAPAVSTPSEDYPYPRKDSAQSTQGTVDGASSEEEPLAAIRRGADGVCSTHQKRHRSETSDDESDYGHAAPLLKKSKRRSSFATPRKAKGAKTLTKGARGSWAEDEHNALHMSLVNQRATEKAHDLTPLRDVRLWSVMSDNMASLGHHRTFSACRLYWSRYGRASSGFDERVHPTGTLVTSAQGRRHN